METNTISYTQRWKCEGNEFVKDLLSLFKSRGIEIASAWAGLISQIPPSQHMALALEDIRSSTIKGIDALIEMLEVGSDAGLDAYLRDLSVVRLGQGFDIDEALQALLLLRRAVLPYLFTIFPGDTNETYQAHIDLDACLRSMVGRFGHLYSSAVNQTLHLQQQQAHNLAEENAGLYRQTQQRLEESLSLQRITSALLQKHSLDEVLNVVCCEALGLIQAEGSAVYMLEADGWLRSAHQVGSGLPTYDTMPLDESFTGQAVKSGRPMYTNDPISEPLWYGRKADPGYVWQISSLLAAPLLVK